MSVHNLEAMIDNIAGSGWVCLQPMRWNELYELLPQKTRVGVGWEPPAPLILGAWWDTTHTAKKQRFLEHLEWAHSHGAIDCVMAFLKTFGQERLALHFLD